MLRYQLQCSKTRADISTRIDPSFGERAEEFLPKFLNMDKSIFVECLAWLS